MARIIVLGAAGFLGSHLADRLLERGESVVGIDDLSSGSLRNISHLSTNPRFEFLTADISQGIPVLGDVDAVLNFASLASPPRYFMNQLHTLRTGSQGTDNALKLATNCGARFIMASTSEVYGDPEVHPQVETYRGSVNPIGPRSCYDEAKRYAEALCMAYRHELESNVGIVRIFNTYGPRLDVEDGRVVSNFVCQALRGDRLTVFGEGTQTRSFCFVDDEIDGILRMLDSDEVGPINIGNPVEFTMLDLAKLILELTASSSTLEFQPLPTDDPLQRCPDITRARQLLGWEPKIDLRTGLTRTIDWFRDHLD
jgi:dTDP-glucose 4,6-dehydratase